MNELRFIIKNVQDKITKLKISHAIMTQNVIISTAVVCYLSKISNKI